MRLKSRKTARLVEQLEAVPYKHSSLTDADEQVGFRYQPDDWSRTYRFIALQYGKEPEAKLTGEPEQYQRSNTPGYTYRVFVTNMGGPLDVLVWFYNQRAGAENLIRETNNDTGLTAHPSKPWMTNANWFQIGMPAYNLNCWPRLFNCEQRRASISKAGDGNPIPEREANYAKWKQEPKAFFLRRLASNILKQPDIPICILSRIVLNRYAGIRSHEAYSQTVLLS